MLELISSTSNTSSTDPATTTPGAYTFYGRYVGWNASDNRQPLPTTFGAHYREAGDVIVWRDSKVDQKAFACGSRIKTDRSDCRRL